MSTDGRHKSVAVTGRAGLYPLGRAHRGDPMASVSGALTGGFFGCLGVLGAMVAAVLLLVMCSSMGGEARTDSLMAGTAPASDYLAFCAEALGQVERRYRGADGAETSVVDPIVLNAGATPLHLACRANHRRGPLVYEVELACPRHLDGCVQVTGAALDGRPLDPRP